jgi:hypothetical protein
VDLDYRSEPDLPGRCAYNSLMPLDSSLYLLAAQKRAEEGKDGSPYSDPRRLAAASLGGFLKIDPDRITNLKLIRRSAAQISYRWKRKNKAYVVVVSHPYWLSLYARDPNRPPWITIAAYETFCR